MQSAASSAEEYIEQLPIDRKEVFLKLRNVILRNLPKGFEERMSYGMIGYVVPHSLYPDGYHCDPKLPLPFINLASQKNHIGFYHMGLYSDTDLMNWFKQEYPKHITGKIDMGKSCIRFKNMNKIPYDLIGELVGKVTPNEWMRKYESVVKK